MSKDLRDKLNQIYKEHISGFLESWEPLKKTDSLICREFWSLLCLTDWSKSMRWSRAMRERDMELLDIRFDDPWVVEVAYAVLRQVAEDAMRSDGLPVDGYLATIAAATDKAKQEIDRYEEEASKVVTQGEA